MKLKFTPFFLLCLFLFSFDASAQNCEAYYPMEPNTVMETTNYNAKGKIQGKNVQTILERSGSDDKMSATIKSEHFDKKDKPTMSNEYEVKCSEGKFTVDMKALMNPETFSSYGEMEVEVDTDELAFPTDASAGTTLPDATLTARISMNGTTIMTINIYVTNRKVEAVEDITTPAGTFKCVKLSQDVETRMLMKIQARSVEWYAKDTGPVRTESYNKNGKMTGYTELTNIIRP